MAQTVQEIWDYLRAWVEEGEHIVAALIVLAVAVTIALLAHFILKKTLARFARRTVTKFDDMLVQHLAHPLKWLLVALAARLTVPLFAFGDPLLLFVRQVFSIVLILLVSWLLVGAAYLLEDYVLLRFRVDVRDNLRARKMRTQITVLKRMLIVTIGVIALGAILMTFDRVKQLGTSLLASAGIAGIVLGLAAQKTLGTFIAGLQIAFTQPIRIDDVVIVEGEWGRIEEITLTYVVVRIWDQRRLIVPITYFIDKPFQNWTRQTAELLGTVYLYVDHSVPIDELREELTRILDGSDKWDRRVGLIQVTDITEKCLQLRALVSAADAGSAWDLRCLVRERLIRYVQQNYPQALPHLRTNIDALPLQADVRTTDSPQRQSS